MIAAETRVKASTRDNILAKAAVPVVGRDQGSIPFDSCSVVKAADNRRNTIIDRSQYEYQHATLRSAPQSSLGHRRLRVQRSRLRTARGPRALLVDTFDTSDAYHANMANDEYEVRIYKRSMIRKC